MEKHITKNFKETQELGATFATQMLRKKTGKTAVVLCLSGPLGAGKTTFLQGFAKGLGVEEVVNSPTFVLMKRFVMPVKKVKIQKSKFKSSIQNSKFTNFYHMDCYRIESPAHIENLGFKEIIKNPENIVAIEWPEKISEIIPKHAILIEFKHLEENKRELTFSL